MPRNPESNPGLPKNSVEPENEESVWDDGVDKDPLGERVIIGKIVDGKFIEASFEESHRIRQPQQEKIIAINQDATQQDDTLHHKSDEEVEPPTSVAGSEPTDEIEPPTIIAQPQKRNDSSTVGGERGRGNQRPNERRARAQANAPAGQNQVQRQAEKKMIPVWEKTKEKRDVSDESLSKEKREQKLKKLWPEGVESPFKQGKIGDCYVLAALDCIKHTFGGEAKLLDMVEEVSEGNWKVKFFNDKTKNTIMSPDGTPVYGSWEWVEVSSEEVKRDSEKFKIEGAFGDLLIERAFLRFINKYRKGQEGQTVDARQDNGRLVPEGGRSYLAMRHFVGVEYTNKIAYKPEDVKVAIGQIAAGENKIMAMASRANKNLSGDGIGRRMIFSAKKALGITPPLLEKHAYRIGRVDLNKQQIELVNPHDTSKSTFFSFDDFMSFSPCIFVVEKTVERIKKNDQKK